MNSTTLNHDDRLQNMIIQDEGFRGKLYRDTEGCWTIGIGFCLDRIEMPEIVACYWLNHRINEIYNQLEHCEDIAPIFNQLDEVRQMAILNMCYQLGVRGVHKFRNMWAALKTADYEEAAREAKDSLWYTQTPNRANRIAEVIEFGTLTPYEV